jgi:hypothetical protein
MQVTTHKELKITFENSSIVLRNDSHFGGLEGELKKGTNKHNKIKVKPKARTNLWINLLFFALKRDLSFLEEHFLRHSRQLLYVSSET